jgi:hypothetical protein
MFPLSLHNVQIVLAATGFVLGFICVLIGIIILITRGYSREVRALATHAAKLGQKGIGYEVSGLVTSASDLVNAINGLVRTASGVGIFLVFLGMAMLAASYWIATQIEWAVL